MRFGRICIALSVLVAPWNFAVQASAQPVQPDAEVAGRLFQAGKFSDAGKLYEQVIAQTPNDYPATLQLGRIALLSNQLDDAQKWFEKAIALKPNDTDAKVMLATVYYRRDEFQKAAAALDGVDVASNELIKSQYPTLNVAKLQSFKGQTPYDLQGEGETIRLKFVETEPLPLLSVRVNGGDAVTFFIDTGGSEVTLDTEFARELGIPLFGQVKGTFSGGQQAEVHQGRIESLALGDWTIKNLPVATLALRQLSKAFGVKRIDGIIGTTLLYHFLATLDYPRGELVLRRKTATNLAQFKAASSGKSVAVPFWIAGDHFMVGWGRVERSPPALLFVDTGLAGAGVKLAESEIKQAGIRLQEEKAYQGAGGGGTLRIVPYTVRQLSFGELKESNVPGLYDGPFPWEKSFGFHLAGMVGHDFFKPYAVTFDFTDMQIFLQSQ
jgi:tetratricopeptide (TPR) repeat protein